MLEMSVDSVADPFTRISLKKGAKIQNKSKKHKGCVSCSLVSQVVVLAHSI